MIGGAFIATLWGVLSANVLWLPFASKLKRMSELEAQSDGARHRGPDVDPGRQQPARHRAEARAFLPADAADSVPDDKAA
jgi:chemotaxis protein MotA